MTTEKTLRGRPRDDGRRERVLTAATAHVLEHGLSDITVRSLAAALGTSPRMLLYDFDSSSALLIEVSNRARREIAAMVREQLQREPSPAKAVEAVWEWFTDDAHVGYARFMVDVRRALLDGSLPLQQSEEPIRPVFAELDAPPEDHTLVTTVFSGLLELHLSGQRGAAAAAMQRFLGVLRTE